MERKKFRIYHAGGDELVFVALKTITMLHSVRIDKAAFMFLGFSNHIHPYHKKRMEWMQEILKGGLIHLVVKTVPTVHDMGGDPDVGFNAADIELPANIPVSVDGAKYYLIQNSEMGRGWAMLVRQDYEGKQEFLLEDHRDNVLDELQEGSLIRDLGIDYKMISLEALDGVNFTELVKKDDSDGTAYGNVQCDICTHTWMAVRPEGLKTLECPNCGNMVRFTPVP